MSSRFYKTLSGVLCGLTSHRDISSCIRHEIASLLAVLMTLSPLVGDKLQIDTSNVNKHPSIQKVLNKHTRWSAYMRKYFKMTLEHATLPCECIACSQGVFSPFTLPLNEYREISALPLPIPQQKSSTSLPSDLHAT